MGVRTCVCGALEDKEHSAQQVSRNLRSHKGKQIPFLLRQEKERRTVSND